MLWSSAANTAVDLNPIGNYQSEALAVKANYQVGFDDQGAVLWSGTAASAVSLAPTNLTGYSSSAAYGLSADGKQVVGTAGGNATNGYNHATLWYATANSAVDLNPAGINYSFAEDSNGSQQVGYGFSNTAGNAFVWTGTAASVVDLENYLPTGATWTGSQAYSIDASGNIFGFGFGTVGNSSGRYAIEWSPISVPEPASLSIMAILGPALLRRSRYSRSDSIALARD
jgi:hypothetical protein